MYNVNEAKGIDSTTFVNSYMYQAWFYKSNDNNWNWDDNIKNDLWTVYTNPANPSYMRTLFYDETNNAVKVANMHLQNQETLYWKAERLGGGYYYPYYSNSYTSALPYQVQARPIIIKVPYDEYRSKGGIRIGLCLTNNNGKNNSLNGKIAYSNKKLNPDKAYFSAVKQVEMNGTTYTLIGLEDAKGGDNDCNDFMFLLETPVEIIEPESDTKGMIWTIAYEDMGSVGDFDFNDVVLRVQHIANTDATKIVTRVWLMAAGGTLPAHLYYRGESKEIDLGEVHEKFGVGEKVMVNTEYGTGFSKEPILLYANTEGGLPDFDLSTTTGAGRFVLKVEKDGQTYEVAQPTDGGTVPQGICISGQWTWPKETVEIYKAYPLVDNSTTEGGWKGGGFGTSGWENQKVSSNLVSCDKDVLTLINTAN